MISLKRYLDSSAAGPGLLASLLDAYQTALAAMGRSAARACPVAGTDLEGTLIALGRTLADSDATDPDVIAKTGAQVTRELAQFGELAATGLAQKTEDVKMLLAVLTRTASTIAATDEGCARRFGDFSARIARIATLDDITQLRASLLASASELDTYVKEMSEVAQESATRLKMEITTYQSQLEEAEQVASTDPLTGLWNRGKIEAHIASRVAFGRRFSVAMLDLNDFKAINDRLGHAAGDDILKQFSGDLKSNSRPTDHIGRWGGDKFIVVLDCGWRDAQAHFERLEKWILGDYAVETAMGRQKLTLDASIGIAEWTPGRSAHDVIDKADQAMYSRKRMRRSH